MRERDLTDSVRDGLWIALFGVLFRRRSRKTRPETSLPEEPPPALRPQRGGHETTDASAKGLGIFAICMAIVLLLITLAPLPIMVVLSKTHGRPLPHVDRVPVPPSPHLGPPGDAEIMAMRQRDLRALNSYGWVDQNAGIAHVPVETVIPRVAAELNAANASAADRRPPTADHAAQSAVRAPRSAVRVGGRP